MREDNDKSNKLNLLSEGIIISLSILLTYFLVFIYEASYLRYFNIPYEFISVDLERFIIYAGAVSGILAIFYIVFELVFLFLPKRENLFGRHIFKFVVALVIIFIPILYMEKFRFRWSYLIYILIYALFYFAFPLIHTNKKKYKDKLIEQIETENYTNLLDRVGGLFGNKGGLFIAIFFYFVGISLMLGTYNAKEQKEFIVVSIDNNDFAVLRLYKDNGIILLKINQNDKVFYSTFYAKNMDELSSMSLERKKIGQMIYANKE